MTGSGLDAVLSRVSSIEASVSSLRPQTSRQRSTSFEQALRSQQVHRSQPSLPSLAGANGIPAAVAPATKPPLHPNNQWATVFDQAAADYGLPVGLLDAVAEVESMFDPHAVSPAGAQGLMQFMPGTATEMGVDPFDPVSAIDGAARYLARDIERFGSVELALAAYNAGPGAVARFDGIPPYRETQNYVTNVLDAWGATP